MSEETTFCPLMTVVKEERANYMVCQTNCVFHVGDECAFIATARLLKEVVRPKVIEMVPRDPTDES